VLLDPRPALCQNTELRAFGFQACNLLKFKDTYKICDWGISILGVSDKTQTNISKGLTPPYDDPELEKDRVNLFACDIFSLGISLLHLMGIGIPVLKNIKNTIKRDISLFNSQLRVQIDFAISNSKTKKADEWRTLLTKCLAVHHKGRFSIEELNGFFNSKFSKEFFFLPPAFVSFFTSF